ncbi:carbamoyltransferase [Sorangium cellulosum]|uniref:Carbamoyltransferase n=1 Tax=Sorangium cellulosum TaxID=56 RepID=A0A4P2PY75_SORCE|nr:carbamoyltransferase C-terminal domain-containing protein [Sorangium cellulosum]AUX21621.1 carbamoyltransferase [Sorangium cellulosum]
MLTLGLSGGLSFAHEEMYDIPKNFTHDGAAVLVEDGEVVAGIEEERLNRIKHSNKFPIEATRFCLARRGVDIDQVDRIAFYASEEYCNALLGRVRLLTGGALPRVDARTLLAAKLGEGLGRRIDRDRIVFVPHHQAHAASTYLLSGYDDSLIVAIDGSGDFLSGLVAVGTGDRIEVLSTFPEAKSLGNFYVAVISLLGYGVFDEYKVMGLAPYGDPARYRAQMSALYTLLPGGDYEIHRDRVGALAQQIEVRRRGGPFTQQHRDVAASLQEALETIVMHALRHQREVTGKSRLCLAGGVAHNCTMNGKIAYSGLFEGVFVQPAAHDAGCALGAALHVSLAEGALGSRRRLTHVFWGSDVGEDAEIEAELSAWSRFLSHERAADLPGRVADLLASGAAVGWAQGASEFGPRALGHRSILADPRPAANKDLINAMVKKREAYRPFAPSVLEEDARELFELPPGQDDFPFMIFVLKVREDRRSVLGATTHVDGTARVHTVSQKANPRFHGLLKAFKDRTGVPALLNTSFNNNVEPIVDSAHDVVTSFLTTGLHHLAIGDYIATKRDFTWEDVATLALQIPKYVRVDQIRRFVAMDRAATVFELRNTYDAGLRVRVSPDVGEALMRADGSRSIRALLAEAGADDPARARKAVEEIEGLWSQRLVSLRPLGAPRAAAEGDGRWSQRLVSLPPLEV